MNKISPLFALALGSLAASGAMAEEVSVSACTTDGKQVTMPYDIAGTVTFPGKLAVSVHSVMQDLFAKSMKGLTGSEAISEKGVLAFANSISDIPVADDSSDDFKLTPLELPRISGECKPQ